jgi:hypothetical protein
MKIGTITGEICNREGCKGIMHDTMEDASCSCHIHPPCSKCVNPDTYCSSCGETYSPSEEKSIRIGAPYEFKVKTIADLDNTKISYYSFPHTHFSMRFKGVYPKDWNDDYAQKEIIKKINSSFGGRFSSFKNGEFEYIGYTD